MERRHIHRDSQSEHPREASRQLRARVQGREGREGKFTTNSVGNVWAQVLAGDHKGRFVCVRNGKGTYAKRK